jgi:hypothetical protein
MASAAVFIFAQTEKETEGVPLPLCHPLHHTLFSTASPFLSWSSSASGHSTPGLTISPVSVFQPLNRLLSGFYTLNSVLAFSPDYVNENSRNIRFFL